MVQKSILSFFSAPKAKKPEGGASGSTSQKKKKRDDEKTASSEPEDSPLKKHSRRKFRVIESDSEDETEPQQPSTSSSPSKSDEEKENKVRESPVNGKANKEDPEGEGSTSDSTDADHQNDKKGKGTKKSPAVKSTKKKTPIKNVKARKGKKSDEAKEDNQSSDDEKMDTEEESVNENRENDEGQKKMDEDSNGKLEDGDDSIKKDHVDSPPTPEKNSSPSSSQHSPGFTPSTVPPQRKTARKQMKRKIDSMEDKQRENIKKLKGEVGSPNTVTKKQEEESKEVQQEEEDSKVEKEEEKNSKVEKKEEKNSKVEKKEEKDSKAKKGEEKDSKAKKGEEKDSKAKKGEEKDSKAKKGEEDSKVEKEEEKNSKEEKDSKAKKGEEDSKAKKEEEDSKVKKGEGKDSKAKKGEEKDSKAKKEENDSKVEKEEEKDSKVEKEEEKDSKVEKEEEKDSKVKKGEGKDSTAKKEEKDNKAKKEEKDNKSKMGEEKDSKVEKEDEKDSKVEKEEEKDNKAKKKEEMDSKVEKEEEKDSNAKKKEEKDSKAKKKEEDSKVEKEEEKGSKVEKEEEKDSKAKKKEEKDSKVEKEEEEEKGEKKDNKSKKEEDDSKANKVEKDSKVEKEEEKDKKLEKKEEEGSKGKKEEEKDRKVEKEEVKDSKGKEEKDDSKVEKEEEKSEVEEPMEVDNSEEEEEKPTKKKGKPTNEEKPTKKEEKPSKKEEKLTEKEEKQTKKEEKSTPGRPKPTSIHSFFAPRPAARKSTSPVMNSSGHKRKSSSPVKADEPKSESPPSLKSAIKEEALEEENCSSPMKKLKPDKNGKANKKKKGSPPKVKNEKQSPKKEKSDKEEVTEAAEKTEKKRKIGKEESAEAVEKTVKKPKINPFAPKPASGSKDVGADYNPGKKKYHPIDDAFWNKSEKVPYLALAKTLELIENTSGRLRTIEMLANFYRSVIVLSPDDLLYCVYLCLNKVAPAFEGIELGIGETIVMRTIAQASGRSVEMIKSDAEKQGDLGIVAEQSRSSQRLMFQPAKLNVKTVFDKLKEIALMSGNASQSKKIDKIKGMYVACRYSESRYLIRSLGGKLRIGLAEQSILQALAQACYLTPPGQDYPPDIINAGAGVAPDRLKVKVDDASLILKTTYCEFPSYDKIIPVLLEEGLKKLPERCQLTPGMPLKPMLAHPTTGVSEVLRRFENAKFTCEFKYDGERAQIHLKEDGTINIYSRNQEDNTTKYPDIISRFKNALGDNVKSCVIDSEAVAWDREKKQILPFQVLSTRKRKDANEKDIKVQVCVFPFDLLYLNGEPQVRRTFEHRRALLKENFKEVEGEFVFAKSMDSTNTEDIEEFLEESIKGNCEGLMVKTLDVDATYEIAKRSRNWLKLKKDYLEGVGDTIDVVPIGGYMGKGKRAGQFGGFLLACYDPDNEEYQSLCKIGTGFTDESLTKHSEFFKDHTIEKPKSYYRYENGVAPDQWFEPVQVWEIKCADLSISPVHKAAAGIVDPEKGISLRFPRFLRIREDKTPEDATSSSQIADLYNSQDQIKNKKSSKTEEEDFY